MSSSEFESSDSESSISMSDSEMDVAIEVEDPENIEREAGNENDSDFEPYADEPLADEVWQKDYEKEMSAVADQEVVLERRKRGITKVSEW